MRFFFHKHINDLFVRCGWLGLGEIVRDFLNRGVRMSTEEDESCEGKFTAADVDVLSEWPGD